MAVDSATAAPTAIGSPAAQSSGRLAQPISYGSGSIRFDAPPAAVDPKISAAAALKALVSSGLYQYVTADRRPEILLASFTSYQRSTRIDSSTKRLVPTTSGELVWLIRYQKVPDVAVGAGAAEPAESAGPASGAAMTVDHDVIGVVDANTGVLEQVDSANSDTVPESAPSPAMSVKASD